MKTCKLYSKGCGGCPLLKEEYCFQLQKKQAQSEKLLKQYGPVLPIRGMDDPFHYRNKAIATFTMANGKLTAGIYAAKTHKVIWGSDSCLLQSELCNRTISAVVHAASVCRYTPYNEDTRSGLLRHVQVRHAFTTGQILVTLVIGQPVLPGAKKFVSILTKEAPWITSIVLNINQTFTSAVLGAQEKTLYGSGMIRDILCGKSYLISSRSFYQINPIQTDKLYNAAIEASALTGTEKVIDAYCGIGTIGLTASDHCKEVIGVELNKDAVKNAIGNAKHNKAANAHFICDDATSWISRQAACGQTADVIFMDPPRAGSTPEFISSVIQMSPSRVVYVSCDQTTLARDLHLFVNGGYSAQSIQPVDMFPHSEPTETVVLLQRQQK